MFKRQYRFITKIVAIIFLLQLSIILNDELEYFEILDEANKISNITENNIFNSKINDLVDGDNPVEKLKKLNSLDEKLEYLYKHNLLGAEKDNNVNLGLFDSQECLLEKTLTKQILDLNGQSKKSIDENLRFILGKCNPVLMIPGLYSTRIMLTINCKNFTANQDNLINMRLFCGESICKDNNEYEEHVMWPALFDSPFQLHVTDDNKYSSCFGYFFKFHKASECPKIEVEKESQSFFFRENTKSQQSICLHDEAVKITFWGGTEKTEQMSQCGIAGIRNIVSVGSKTIKESWVNSGSARAFEDMYNRYYEMGYRPGFSIAGLPYDFRRFVATNGLFKNIFKSQIEKLFENTGKPVIIIAHSYGGLNSLNQIIESEKDIQFLNKIKKFIAVGPPFAGSPKEVEIFLHGSNEFDTKFSFRNYDLFDVQLDEFGQRLVFPLTPAGYELRPNPIFYKLFLDNKYIEFKEAIEERLFLEKECKIIDCDEEYILAHSKKFNILFPHFPTLHSSECRIDEIISNPKYIKLLQDFSGIPNKGIPSFLPCRNDIYNTVSCPTIKLRLDESEDFNIIESKHCHGNITETNDIFNHSCEKTKNCLDKFFHHYYPYPYLDEKMFELFQKFYLSYSSQFPDVTLDFTTYFDTKEILKKKIEKMIEYQSKTNAIRNLDIPKVDTMIIYGSYVPTRNAYIFDQIKNMKSFDTIDILNKGGDGTVPSWSSLLVGLKWLYEKKLNNLPNKVQLVEYCSTLSKKGSEYAYDETNSDKEFMAISCDCLNSDYSYDFKKTSSSLCEHGTLIGDSQVIKFIENYIMDDKNIINNINITNSTYSKTVNNGMSQNSTYIRNFTSNSTIPGSIINALENYRSEINYEYICNTRLRNISDY